MDNETDPAEPNGGEIPKPESTSVSFARFLYNQNPFYLISCLLVIYGCQSFAVSEGGLTEKTTTMVGGLLGYSLLMSVVCIGVVRLAKVWDDARSIFIVVIISLIAMTTGFDELCIGYQSIAQQFAGVTAFAILIITELTLRLSRLRLGLWYRLAYYTYFSALIAAPLLLGDAVANRNDPLANWGSMLFSIAIGISMLVLLPAVRNGAASARDSGTPWSWPLYPLSAFLVMYVLAGVRSHAIWMSFGFYGRAGTFEPILLLPLFASALILITEYGLATKQEFVQHYALAATTALIGIGHFNEGRTLLPIQSDLHHYVGSAATLTGLTVFLMFGYFAVRRVQGAGIGLPLVLTWIGMMAPLPQVAVNAGLERWMLFAMTGLWWAVLALRSSRPDWMWLLHSASMTATIVLAGQSAGYLDEAAVAGVGYATIALLWIGGCYRTQLAHNLRYVSAILVSSEGVVAMYLATMEHRPALTYATLAIAILAFGYAIWVHRQGWVLVSIANLALFITVASYQGHQSGRLYRINWPIAAGILSLGVGLAITTGKTGAYSTLSTRLRVSRSETSSAGKLLPGF
ncbi:hypothetical protein [Rhodopirellula sp. MGV]|uniref:hypothetical protein n=1 Tax=Rhodopirellula sp. MGV TaxID=2023130 RepID=UPI001179D0D5|nr:hypothetical protein [Rhodopirellula sp. MGV]